jgi:hypothetical protein
MKDKFVTLATSKCCFAYCVHPLLPWVAKGHAEHRTGRLRDRAKGHVFIALHVVVAIGSRTIKPSKAGSNCDSLLACGTANL